jgi:hypothetical protein
MKINEITEAMPAIMSAKKAAQIRAAQSRQATSSVGTQNRAVKPQGTSQQSAAQAAGTNAAARKEREVDQRKELQLKPGNKIVLPTATGDTSEYKITKTQGQEVEIENPDGKQSAGQPNKLTFNRDDVKASMARR